MRISDWSSDVCSSDLAPAGWPSRGGGERVPAGAGGAAGLRQRPLQSRHPAEADGTLQGIRRSVAAASRDPAELRRRIRESGPIALSRRPLRRSRSEEHTSELQSLMRTSYAVFCLKKNTDKQISTHNTHLNPYYSSSMHQYV